MTHRQIPPIGRGPQQFSPSNQPMIQNPMSSAHNTQPQFFEAPGVSIQDELALEIYCRLAFDHIRNNPAGLFPDSLHTLAQAAKQAAAIYFEEQPSNG